MKKVYTILFVSILLSQISACSNSEDEFHRTQEEALKEVYPEQKYKKMDEEEKEKVNQEALKEVYPEKYN